MATASQKMTEIKFLVLILGAFTPPPTMLKKTQAINIQVNSNQNLILLESYLVPVV